MNNNPSNQAINKISSKNSKSCLSLSSLLQGSSSSNRSSLNNKLLRSKSSERSGSPDLNIFVGKNKSKLSGNKSDLNLSQGQKRSMEQSQLFYQLSSSRFGQRIGAQSAAEAQTISFLSYGEQLKLLFSKLTNPNSEIQALAQTLLRSNNSQSHKTFHASSDGNGQGSLGIQSYEYDSYKNGKYSDLYQNQQMVSKNHKRCYLDSSALLQQSSNLSSAARVSLSLSHSSQDEQAGATSDQFTNEERQSLKNAFRYICRLVFKEAKRYTTKIQGFSDALQQKQILQKEKGAFQGSNSGINFYSKSDTKRNKQKNNMKYSKIQVEVDNSLNRGSLGNTIGAVQRKSLKTKKVILGNKLIKKASKTPSLHQQIEPVLQNPGQQESEGNENPSQHQGQLSPSLMHLFNQAELISGERYFQQYMLRMSCHEQLVVVKYMIWFLRTKYLRYINRCSNEKKGKRKQMKKELYLRFKNIIMLPYLEEWSKKAQLGLL